MGLKVLARCPGHSHAIVLATQHIEVSLLVSQQTPVRLSGRGFVSVWVLWKVVKVVARMSIHTGIHGEQACKVGTTVLLAFAGLLVTLRAVASTKWHRDSSLRLALVPQVCQIAVGICGREQW